MQNVQRLTIAAHAKINLALAVGPPEGPKGYHPICSWMTAVDLFDDLIIERKPEGPSTYTIEWAHDAPRSSPIDWPIEKDLAVRAHRFMEHLAGRELPINLIVRKRIPVGGGLGGGSSDAAAMLAGLTLAFDEITFDLPHIAEVCTALGSDVGFFFDPTRPAGCPSPAIVGGFGEAIERVKPFERPIVLFIPDFGTPTGPVYNAFDARPPHPIRESVVRVLASQAEAATSESLFNDLAEPAMTIEPRLRLIRETLEHTLKIPIHITGSGSTMFAIVSDRVQRMKVLKAAKAAVPQVVSLSATTV